MLWTPAHIMASLSGSSKGEALQEIAEMVSKALPDMDSQTIIQVLWAREKLGNTARGHGVAIPHGVFEGLKQVELFFGRSESGLGFESLDGRSVHFIFVLLAPKNAVESYLPWLGRITQFSGLPVVRTRLMQAAGQQELLEVLSEM